MASATKDASNRLSRGYDLAIFKDPEKAKEYECSLCHLVCRNAVELSCGDDRAGDSADDHDVLFCEHCLSENLRSNERQCPINILHRNVEFNVARNIRKQINNLTVHCGQHKTEGVGCQWTGKLIQFEAHRKCCSPQRAMCRLCGVAVAEHDAVRMAEHISILHSKLEAMAQRAESARRRQREAEEWRATAIADAAKQSERMSAMEHRIESLLGEQQRLRERAQAQSAEIEHFRSIVAATERVDRRRDGGCGRNEEEKWNEGLLRNDSRRRSERIDDGAESDDEAQSRSTDTHELAESEDGSNGQRALKCPAPPLRTLSVRSLSSTPGPMDRSSSTRYFHPEGVELYHPLKVKYERFHPQRAVKVRVVGADGGGMKWRSRWMCCGAAKGESVYLMDVLDQKRSAKGSAVNSRKRRRSAPSSAHYVVVRPDGDGMDKLPQKWRANMHRGCRRRKSGTFKCCGMALGSAGCAKRYKCCKRDVSESRGSHRRVNSGCKVGWGC